MVLETSFAFFVHTLVYTLVYTVPKMLINKCRRKRPQNIEKVKCKSLQMQDPKIASEECVPAH
jgi:hypothetical protein